jgi:hypothetical protein
MKQKIMYIIFALATIALLIFINKKDDNTGQLVSKESIPQELSGEQQSLSAQNSQPILPSEGKPGITIIKKSKPKEEVVSSEIKKTNTTVRPKKASASSSLAVSSSTASTDSAAAKKPVAGVTKVGKRPSPEQTNELNEQGIIMY